MMKMRILAVLFLVIAAAGADAPDPAKIKEKVTIEVGKKKLVQFEQKGDDLKNPKVVEKADDKLMIPSFDFSKSDGNLILTTKNPFPKNLKFRALARLKGRKDYFETSIVPVQSGLLSFELWQDPIEELILFDFKLTDEK